MAEVSLREQLDREGRLQHLLMVDGCRRAFLSLANDGRPRLHFEVYGPLQWEDVEPLIIGLMELGLKAQEYQHRWETRVNGKKE